MCVCVCVCVCWLWGIKFKRFLSNIVYFSEFVSVGVAWRKYQGINPLCHWVSVFVCFCVWVGLCIYVVCTKDVIMFACVYVRERGRKRWLLVNVYVCACSKFDSLNYVCLCC